jgi:chitinase
MMPEEIPYGQYTHIIFSFATINPSTFKVSAGHPQTEYMMRRIYSIKFVQADIKIWVALGGWSFNNLGPTQTTFSDIASSAANTNIFLDSLAQMMNKYRFDGVDIDWEYPAAEDRHGRPEDYKNIVTFMTKLNLRMKDTKKGISMVLPTSYRYLQNFDIKALESQVDWFNIMSYDEHGSWDIDNESTGPWVNSHTNMTDIQSALDLLWRNDIDPRKVTMGMAFYGRSFTLTDPACSTLGCRVSSGGNPGKTSGMVGVLLHAEIQEIIAEKNLTAVLDRVGAVKTVSWDNQWVSFDDAETWRLKADIARSQCIESFMVWAMSQDDRERTNIIGLNQALGRKEPLFANFTIIEEQPVVARPMVAPELCRWSGCYEGCPSGFKAVPHDGYDEVIMDASVCYGDSAPHRGVSIFCCPSEYMIPSCTWRGHKNSGKCSPGCNSGETEVGSRRLGCRKNHQSACCTWSPMWDRTIAATVDDDYEVKPVSFNQQPLV